MTPQARVASASDILQMILDGAAAEKVLTNWARSNRFAGSKDRAAIRDHVFDALRCRRSAGWLGGCDTGRGLMIGLLRARGIDPATMFTGQGYAAPELNGPELAGQPPLDDAPTAVRLDCPEWLWDDMVDSLGDDVEPVLTALQSRAQMFVRVNLAKADLASARASLATEDIASEPHPLSPTALKITGNPRRLQSSSTFTQGLVEIQDAASQAVVDLVSPLARNGTVLDYCAGGGGKALALAASGARQVDAHDANPARMRDIPMRAKRAGAKVSVIGVPDGKYDVVLCDAPCSGSGAWRRQPDAKWRLTRDDLQALLDVQDKILDNARRYVGHNGVLAYATCSLLKAENADRIARFVDKWPDWSVVEHRQFTPLDGGDGFFVAILRSGGGV